LSSRNLKPLPMSTGEVNPVLTPSKTREAVDLATHSQELLEQKALTALMETLSSSFPNNKLSIALVHSTTPGVMEVLLSTSGTT